jgi:hypothetical protein
MSPSHVGSPLVSNPVVNGTDLLGSHSTRNSLIRDDVSDAGSEYETGLEDFDEDDDDDKSVSELSTVEQPQLQQQSPQVVHSDDADVLTESSATEREGTPPATPEKTARRKSVRVSLKPTYAVPPPAVEDGAVELSYSNYDHSGPTSWRDPEERQATWGEDSSDDESVNIEYLRAKKRLGQAQRM